jgi:hypothetical protein
VYPCRAWHEGTQIGRICADLHGFPGGPSSGAGLVGQISEISQISVISVLLPCAVRGNTDWTDLRRFPQISSGGIRAVACLGRHQGCKISVISQISVISVLLSCVAGWNTDWTDLRRFAQIPGWSSSGAGLVEQISVISKISVISVPVSCVA